MNKKLRRKLISRLIELNDRIVTLEKAIERGDGRTAEGKTRQERLDNLIEKRDKVSALLHEEVAKSEPKAKQKAAKKKTIESEPVELLPFEPEDDEVDATKGDE